MNLQSQSNNNKQHSSNRGQRVGSSINAEPFYSEKYPHIFSMFNKKTKNEMTESIFKPKLSNLNTNKTDPFGKIMSKIPFFTTYHNKTNIPTSL